MKQLQIKFSDFLANDTIELREDNLSLDIGFPNNVSVEVRVLKASQDSIYAGGTIKGWVELECARCLKKYKQPVDIKISANIDFINGVADIFEEVRELLILEMPQKPLCSDDCLGICEVCGKANKVNDSCSCESADTKLVKERWAGMFENARKKIKKDK